MATMNPSAAPVKKSSSAAVQSFLIAYNFGSAILWASILGRVLLVSAVHAPWRVHAAAGDFARWTQTLAVLEILFSLFGLVRAPLFTTAMQVASRLLLVWGIVYTFPNATARSTTYCSMLFAWSVTEVVRYSFFAANLTPGLRVPDGLRWMRYNLFFVLYPLGIFSECSLIYHAIPAARRLHPLLPYLLWGILAGYVPGSYVLYSHMMAQRRKVIKGKDPVGKHQQ